MTIEDTGDGSEGVVTQSGTVKSDTWESILLNIRLMVFRETQV